MALSPELISQLLKFAVVGGVNTIVHYTIYMSLIVLTGHSNGIEIVYISTVAFIFANTNSYFLNKLWTFDDKSKSEQTIKFGSFFLVSCIGLLFSVFITYYIVNETPMFFNIHGLSAFFNSYGLPAENVWATVAFVIATGFQMISNFFGYKYIVFKK